jgi:hypothetical protein
MIILQAIQTKYMGPTNFRGSRVKAECRAGSITLSWDDALNSDENHIKAAKALIKKLGWGFKILGAGSIKSSNKGYVFILGGGK